jgi:hypothetical protein
MSAMKVSIFLIVASFLLELNWGPAFAQRPAVSCPLDFLDNCPLQDVNRRELDRYMKERLHPHVFPYSWPERRNIYKRYFREICEKEKTCNDLCKAVSYKIGLRGLFPWSCISH